MEEPKPDITVSGKTKKGTSCISGASRSMVTPTSSLLVAYPHSKDKYMTAVSQAKLISILAKHSR